MTHDLGITNTQEPDTQELLEVERAKQLDQTVRLWLIYHALEYGNAALIDVAHINYLRAWGAYTRLFANTSEEALQANFRSALQDTFHGPFAKEVLKA